MKIGYLGPKGTFTNIAANNLFPNEEIVPYLTIPDCLDAVMVAEVDMALVPIENTLEGSVNITLDYLTHDVDVPIVGEVTVPIRQHLMVHPLHKENWKEVEVIYSHSHAIAQCHKFLHQTLHGVVCENTTSTAAAANFIKENPQIKGAAIGNELTATKYGLEIVGRDIHDYNNNHTRFIVLSKQPLVATPSEEVERKGYKTTMMVTLPSDRSGALHQVLSAFAWRKLNLIKIESRPTKTGLGNYFFLIDIDQAMDDILIPGSVAELEAIGCTVKVFGSYPYYSSK